MLSSKAMMASSAVEPLWVDSVFSTYLYTGTGAAQTITNGIDLAGEGGMVWIKRRDSATDNELHDTERGMGYVLESNNTNASALLTALNMAASSTGFSMNTSLSAWNANGSLYAAWTFRKAPKFFDVVTYTGNGTDNRQVPHSLGSVPGMIIVKSVSAGGSDIYGWFVWHRSLTLPNNELALNETRAQMTNNLFSASGQSSATINFGSSSSLYCNQSGVTYVAYLFAHDAGGFGESGTDSAVSCGSYTGNGSATGPTIDLGYEPQWLLIKSATQGGEDWQLFDVMRGWSVTDPKWILRPNLSNAESSSASILANSSPNSTGFQITASHSSVNQSGATYIYMAIRRPNKPPTIGTQVFSPTTYTGTNVDNRLVNTGILTDMTMARIRTTFDNGGFYTADRLRGNASLGTAITAAEDTDADSFMTPTVGYGNSFSAMNGFGVGNDATRQLNQSSTAQLAYAFKRAPKFFDVVCYTGTGVARTVAHNLTVAPELMIVKRRNSASNWYVYQANLGATKFIIINSNSSEGASPTYWNDTNPTTSVFSVGTNDAVNASGGTYVAYLFATLPGISKVGGYTGTGTTLQINCGFTTGARFILIKDTNIAGDWYVWDTARGIISGNDPYLLLNTTQTEVTSTDYIDPLASGFEISSNAPSAINASGGSYIFLAIA